MNSFDRPTQKQLDYVDGLKRKLKLSRSLLDSHCQATYGVAFLRMSKEQCSKLIDEMVGWKVVPDQLRREAGQRDLFEVGI